MDTVLSQELYGLPPRRLKKLSARIAAEIRRLENLWSIFIEESDVCRISAAAGRHAAATAPETWRLLREAKLRCEQCRGLFDISAAPLVELWRAAARKGRLPRRASLQKARSLVDWRSLGLENSGSPPQYRAFLPKKGQRIDLGGIGKGAAADHAAAVLKKEGLESGLINFGGNVAAIGSRPDGMPWRIGIKNPRQRAGQGGDPAPALIGLLEVEDAAVATSGGYERYFEIGGVRRAHIIDPSTGRPVENDLLSATVAADSAAAADAFATALYVAGLEAGLALAEDLPVRGALLIDLEGTVSQSSGLIGRFFPVDFKIQSTDRPYDPAGGIKLLGARPDPGCCEPGL
jgi:FAD:protein FMN transferase